MAHIGRVFGGEGPAGVLQQPGPLRLGKVPVFRFTVGATEQAVEVHVNKALASIHRHWVAKYQQRRAGQLPLTVDQLIQQMVQNLNGRGFIPMDASGNNQRLIVGVGAPSRGFQIEEPGVLQLQPRAVVQNNNLFRCCVLCSRERVRKPIKARTKNHFSCAPDVPALWICQPLTGR